MGKSVSKNSVFSMVNKGLSVIFPLITVAYVSRILGASGIGEVSSSQNLSTYFSMAAALGIPSYGVRAIAQSKKKKEECNKVFTELFTINFISTIFAVVLYFIALYFLRKNYHNLLLSFVFSGTIVFNIINIEWVYQGFEEYRYITIRSFFIKLVSIVFLFVFVRQRNDLVAYALIICFGSIGNYILNFINLKKYVNFCWKNLMLKKHLIPIMTFFVSVIAIEIYSLLDVSMLTTMSTAKNVGYYSNATRIVKAVANTLTGISAVLMPRFSYLFAENNKNEIIRLASKFLNITFLISVPSCMGIILTADQIVSVLLGTEFYPTINTIRILSILIVLMPLSGGVFCQLLLTSGKEKSYLFCVLCGTIVNAILNYLMIPTYVHNGAAIASVIAEFIVSFSMIMISMRVVRISMKRRDIISILFSSIFMVASVLFVRQFLLDGSISLHLIVEVTVGVVAYILGVFIFKNSFSNEVINFIRKKTHKV